MKRYIASYFSGVLTIRDRKTNKITKKYLHNQELANSYLDLVQMFNKNIRQKKHGKLITYNIYEKENLL